MIMDKHELRMKKLKEHFASKPSKEIARDIMSCDDFGGPLVDDYIDYLDSKEKFENT